MKHLKIAYTYTIGALRWLRDALGLFWKRGLWQKLFIVLIAALVGLMVVMYGISRWYTASVADQPREYGVTFIADYARSLGLDADETLDAIIFDLDIDRLRLVSYWNKIEATEGNYDFSELDAQFAKAETAGLDVSLTIGLRQPRWPECHVPDWVNLDKPELWEPKLEAFLAAVVSRYEHSPSLDSWQLENEYFLDAFGECPIPNRDRLQREYDLVKQLDAAHPIVMSRKNNYPAIALRGPLPDQVGVSVYRRVWDGNFTKRYFTYPLPAWYYGAVAGVQKIFTGRESVLHEMQMEPWPAAGQFVRDATLDEQDKSFKAEDFESRVKFAENTGLRTIDFWGAEWWYWRMIEKGDPSFWNEAKEHLDG